VDVSVNKYKCYTQLGPIVRASLHRRTPKTRLRLGGPIRQTMSKIIFMRLQRIIFRNTPTYDTSVSQQRRHKSASFKRHYYSLRQRNPTAEEDMLFCSLQNKSH